MRIYLLILFSLTFLYGEDACVANGVPYGNGGNLDFCQNGDTGCDCYDECGGSAYVDDCGVCSGGNTGLVPDDTQDECGICDGSCNPSNDGNGNGTDDCIQCWDESLVCPANNCPINPDDCLTGTVGMENPYDDDDIDEDDIICVPTRFALVNQSNKYAYYYFDLVTINGVSVDANDWVGAFNGDVCVGTRSWGYCGGEGCDVPVFGDNGTESTTGYMIPGEIPAFQIYDASENSYYNATPSENVSPWEYQLVVEIIGLNGISLSSKYDGTMPVTYSIYNIYPNPFNPITSIEYSLPENAAIELIAYNIHGRHIQTLLQGFQTAGYHSINWNAQNYPSGVYLIRLGSSTYSKTQKVVLIK